MTKRKQAPAASTHKRDTTNLRQLAEKMVPTGNQDTARISEKEIIKLFHDLQVDQVELELQKKELLTTQLELEKARDHYQNLYDFAPVACFTVDKDDLICEVNLTGCYLIDIARDELINYKFTRLIVDDDADTFRFFRKQVIGSKQKQSCHLRMITNNGNTFYARLEGTVSDIEDRINLSVIDITQHKDKESKLYSCLNESGIVGVFYYNLDGQITDANNKFLEITGYSREDLKAGRMNWIKMTPPEHLKTNEHVITEFLSHGMLGAAYEKEYIRKDGSRVPIVVGETKYDEASLEGIAFIRDISENKQKEKQLKDSEGRYRTLVDTASSAGVGIAVVQDIDNKQGKIVFANKECARISGYTEEELLGMTFDELLPQSVLPFLMDNYVKRQSGGTIVPFYEAAFLTKSGDERPSEISAGVTVYDGKLATIVFVRDITEIKQKEEELRDSERRYKTLVDTASRAGVGIVVVQDRDDKQGKLVFVNEEGARISGYTEEELLDMTFDELLPQRIRPWFRDNYIKRQSGDKVVNLYEAAVLTKSRLEKAVEMSVGITVYSGKLASVAFFRDITERKRIEEELARQKTVLSTVMENTGTQLVYLDRDFNFIMANKAYIDSSEYTWEELKGKNIFSLFPGEAHETFFRKARDSGEAIFRNDMPIGSADQPSRGITYWDSTLVPVKDDEGSVTGIVLSLIETTERKKMEQMKDEFIALVSHELRTPITVISGSLQVTKREGLSIEEKQELIQNAIDVTGNLSDILENMLELSRHQTGRLKLNTERIDISNVINQVMDKMKNAGVRQRFELEIPEVLPLIDADPLRVERILNNLIENAVKYSPADSEIKITVQSDTSFLVISVIDQGKGIPAGIKHKLFQMFERGDDRGMIGGTGLGLVVCKRLVEAHDGWIEAESEPGRGATFSFGLPL